MKRNSKKNEKLEQYNFTFEDIMLKRDLESIKCLINPLYQSSFEIKWNELSISEKQDLIMSYIESIEVIKKDNNELELSKLILEKHLLKNMLIYLTKEQLIAFKI